ncbi:MAG: exopolysaccharide biosynthesis polyprenyl glycosylphosphotransferase [Rhodospirillales bacterium]|nr:exopolysaccharide biosynthesis polyprenyl glycosylphosphotransferase [Rhodospirillales bacterium]
MAALWLAELLLSCAGIYMILAGPWHIDRPAPDFPADFGVLPHALVLAAILGASGMVIGLYRTEICLERRRLLLNAAVAAILAFPVALLVGGHFSMGLSKVYAVWLVKVLVIWLAFVTAIRLLLRGALARRALVRRILVVGPEAAAVRDHARLHAPRRFDFVVANAAEPTGPERFLPATLRRDHVWAILLADRAAPSGDTSDDPSATLEPLRAGRMHGARMFGEASFWEQCLGRVNLDRIDRQWFLSGDGFTDGPFGTAAKRLLDVLVSVVLLTLTFPLMLAVALAVKLDSQGPLFYRQLRVGLHGKPFTLLKFRSMRADAESGGTPRWAARRDDRVTRVGRFIRSTRIDELPQLVNVLRGEMSLVGPRPERPHFVEQLAAVIPFYHERAHVKPGITGWAQVNYPYGASVEDAREKLSYDLYYLKYHGLLLDLLILVSTVRVILFREGAR